MRKALIASLAVAAALVVAATATGRSTAPASATAIPGCAKDTLGLLDSAAATLTIGADNPAFPPWFGGDEKTKPWKVSDPYSGKGYEAAVAYAIAKQLGFSKAQVKWTVTPFNNSFRPGKKPFDFYITQVSYTPERAKAVDFSKGYYFVNQSLVARKGKPIASVRSVNGFKKYQLGAQVGTTSYKYIVDVIKPDSKPRVYDTNDAAVQALKNGQIDGLVVDLPTAFYVTAVQVPDGKVVGQFKATGSKERFGLVLPKGSKLTACANKALDRLWANGTIKNLQRIWLAKATGAPVLK
jgi:polar amino acid transport system substrate-binding protein